MSDSRSAAEIQAFWKRNGPRAFELRNRGLSMREIGEALGTTKNAVVGYLYRNHPEMTDPELSKPVPTIFDRLAALHAKMDAVLAATQPAIDARLPAR